MPDGRQFSYAIVTPEKVEAEGQAEFLTLPGLDGEFGVLFNRAPLLVRLSPGLVRVRTLGEEKWYFVGGGFAQVVHNQVTVLTPRAAASGRIGEQDLQVARDRAKGLSAPDAAGERRLRDAHAEVRALERLMAHAE